MGCEYDFDFNTLHVTCLLVLTAGFVFSLLRSGTCRVHCESFGYVLDHVVSLHLSDCTHQRQVMICLLWAILMSLTFYAIIRGEILNAKEQDLWRDLSGEGETYRFQKMWKTPSS